MKKYEAKLTESLLPPPNARFKNPDPRHLSYNTIPMETANVAGEFTRENKFIVPESLSFSPYDIHGNRVLNPQIFTNEKSFGDNHANARFYSSRPNQSARIPLHQNYQNGNPNTQGTQPFINVQGPNGSTKPIHIIDPNQNYISHSPFKPTGRPMTNNPEFVNDRSSSPIYPRQYIEQHMSISKGLLNSFPLDYSLKQNIEKLGGIEDTIGKMTKEISFLNLNDPIANNNPELLSDDILLQRKAVNEMKFEPFSSNPAEKYKAVIPRNNASRNYYEEAELENIPHFRNFGRGDTPEFSDHNLEWNYLRMNRNIENDEDLIRHANRSRSSSIHSSKNLRADKEDIFFGRKQRKY